MGDEVNEALWTLTHDSEGRPIPVSVSIMYDNGPRGDPDALDPKRRVKDAIWDVEIINYAAPGFSHRVGSGRSLSEAIESVFE